MMKRIHFLTSVSNELENMGWQWRDACRLCSDMGDQIMACRKAGSTAGEIAVVLAFASKAA
jgi:hypothetical protein